MAAFGVLLVTAASGQMQAGLDRSLRMRAAGPARDVLIGLGRRDPGPGGRRGPGGGLGFGPGPGPGGPPPGDRGRPYVVDRSGEPIGPRFAGPPIRPENLPLALAGRTILTDVDRDGERHRVLTMPVSDQGEILGAIQVSEPRTALDGFIRTLWLVLGALLPIAGLAGAGLGAWLSRRMVEPVEGMTRAAQALSSSEAAGALPVTGDEELVTLGSAFNRLLERLQASLATERQAQIDLSRALDAQRRLTADASHELRTPLTRIRFEAESVLAEEGLEAEARRSWKVVDDASDQMARLIERLLILARSDAGGLVLEMEEVQVADAVRRAVDRSGLASRSDISLDLPAGMAVRADRLALEQILVNLLTNAGRMTTEGSGIRISADIAEGQARITIVDHGPGIEPHHLARLGERFFRPDESRSRSAGGTGLGLSIVKALTEAHRGAWTAQSEVGKGTIMTISLPLAGPGPDPHGFLTAGAKNEHKPDDRSGQGAKR